MHCHNKDCRSYGVCSAVVVPCRDCVSNTFTDGTLAMYHPKYGTEKTLDTYVGFLTDEEKKVGRLKREEGKPTSSGPAPRYGKLKDSGARTEFDTGAVRDAQGEKGRFDLLPWSTIWALAKHFEIGCQKYGDRNWEKGIPIKNYMDSGIRHAMKAMMGIKDENHLMAAIWNLVCAYETLLRIKLGVLPADLDNIPYPMAKVIEDSEEFDSWKLHEDFHE